MKNAKFFVLFSCLIVIFFASLKLLSHPSVEFDEGVYWTSFLLFSKGYYLYNPVFFSQPPGFFILTYPVFLLFGQTLEAARLSIFFWSMVGVAGIIWISYELKNLLIGILTIAILYFIPSFYMETLTFHADLLSMVFSILAFASILRFQNNKNNSWLYFSVFNLSLALLTKLNIITAFPIIYVLLKKQNAKNILIPPILLIPLIIPIFLMAFAFDPGSLLANVISFRLKAAAFFAHENKIFDYLNKEGMLSFLTLSNLILLIINRQIIKKYPVLVIWFLSSLVLLFIYHPLEPHHLLFLMIPSAILFSTLTIELSRHSGPLRRSFSEASLPRIISILPFLIISLSTFIYVSFKTPSKITTKSQDKAIAVINKNLKNEDIFISDDALLNAITKKLPPPELVDLSHVRIDSGYLSPVYFENQIIKYKPHMVLAWNGRLIRMKDFEKILIRNNYKLLQKEDKNRYIYIYND